MSRPMTKAERQKFLSDKRIGVIAAPDPRRRSNTLAVPIWYGYAPAGEVWLVTHRDSVKGKALAATGRFALVVQQEELPYRYLSVEGPVVRVDDWDLERDLIPLAQRYLGADEGAAYAKAWWAASDGGERVFRMRPEHWASADYSDDFTKEDAS